MEGHSTRHGSPKRGAMVNKRKLDELSAQVRANAEHTVLSNEVAEVLLELADDFVENVTAFGCRLAKHRKSDVLEVKDLQLYLDRNWGINPPGFGDHGTQLSQGTAPTEAYRQKIISVQKSQTVQRK